jgi:hypothetical protein
VTGHGDKRYVKSNDSPALSLKKPQDIIAKDPTTHGCMFVPTVVGSDGTVVSVATGQNEYHPLYLSIRNVHNQVRRARRGALILIGFLAILKSRLDSCLSCHVTDDFPQLVRKRPTQQLFETSRNTYSIHHSRISSRGFNHTRPSQRLSSVLTVTTERRYTGLALTLPTTLSKFCLLELSAVGV